MRCKICGTTTHTFHDALMQSDFFHCHDCQFIFKDRANYVTSTQELQQYQQHNNTFESTGYVQMFQSFIDVVVQPHKEEVKTALEFGSGPGPVLAQLLRREGFEVDIYDKYFSPQKVYEHKQYDLITSTEVIEHIDDPLALFAFFKTHLRAGGYLGLMTQFHHNTPKSFLQWWYRKDPTHISFFRPHTFEVLAKKFDFTLLFCDDKKTILLQQKKEAE